MDSADLGRRYVRDGCLRVPGFLDAETLSSARRELERYMREIAPTLPTADRTLEADGETVRNLWRMEKHDPYFDRLARASGIVELVRELVHGEPVLMAVESFNKPARIGSGVPPHQDNAYFCQSPPDVLTIWIALDAVTEANGPVSYLKGSHREGTRVHRPSGVLGNSMGLVEMPRHEAGDVLRELLEPGDALIHHCETIHWSDPNPSERPRLGLLMVFRGAHTVSDPTLKQAYDAGRASVATSRS